MATRPEGAATNRRRARALLANAAGPGMCAEIGLIVMQQGRALGPWAVPPELFTAMVGVAALTSIGAPLVVRRLLRTAPEADPG